MVDGEGGGKGLKRNIWNSGSVIISKFFFFFFLHIGENFSSISKGKD